MEQIACAVIVAAIMALDYVILGGGSRSSKLKIAPDVLRGVPNLTVVPGLALAAS